MKPLPPPLLGLPWRWVVFSHVFSVVSFHVKVAAATACPLCLRPFTEGKENGEKPPPPPPQGSPLSFSLSPIHLAVSRSRFIIIIIITTREAAANGMFSQRSPTNPFFCFFIFSSSLLTCYLPSSPRAPRPLMAPPPPSRHLLPLSIDSLARGWR